MYIIKNKYTYERIGGKFKTYLDALNFLKQRYTNNLKMYEIIEIKGA